jgi:ACT domain-containing protein
MRSLKEVAEECFRKELSKVIEGAKENGGCGALISFRNFVVEFSDTGEQDNLALFFYIGPLKQVQDVVAGRKSLTVTNTLNAKEDPVNQGRATTTLQIKWHSQQHYCL